MRRPFARRATRPSTAQPPLHKAPPGPGPAREGAVPPGAASWLGRLTTLRDDPAPDLACDLRPGGPVWNCHFEPVTSSDLQRLRGYRWHDRDHHSSEAPCAGAAVALVTTVQYTTAAPEPALLVCGPHLDWLESHGFIDHMSCGTVARFAGGRLAPLGRWVAEQLRAAERPGDPPG